MMVTSTTALKLVFTQTHILYARHALCRGDFDLVDDRNVMELSDTITRIDHFNNYCLGSHNGAKAALLGSC